MRTRYWLNNLATGGWTEVATAEEADELVRDPAVIGPHDRWSLFVRYGRTKPVLVGWASGLARRSPRDPGWVARHAGVGGAAAPVDSDAAAAGARGGPGGCVRGPRAAR